MTQLKMLSADDKIAEIRRLYFNATRQTIQQDLAKALDLLKSMSTEEERERAVVYMEGLAEMRNDWLRESKPKRGTAAAGGPTRARKPAAGAAVRPSKPASGPAKKR
jgi:hypothetical protein